MHILSILYHNKRGMKQFIMSKDKNPRPSITSRTNMKVTALPAEAEPRTDEDLYVSFEIRFGPKFPVKPGANYKELHEGLIEAIEKEEEGSLLHSFFARTIAAIELGIQTKDAEFMNRTFSGTLWCNAYGCGSCGDCYAEYNCETYGRHCESCGGCH